MTVKIRRDDFRTYTRQQALEPPTQDTAVVAATAQRLLLGWLRTQPDAAVRLLGVGVGDLQSLRQADLFSTAPPKESRLDCTIDGIRDRFGSGVLTRASLLPRPCDGGGPQRR